MNLETINKWLDEEYGCSYTKLEELHNFYFEKYCDLKQENERLKEEIEEYKNPIKYFKYANKNVTDENKKLNGSIQTYDILLKSNIEENKRLKDNWDELKEYCKETKLKEFEKSYGKRYGKTFTQAEIIVCNMILDKMQELEKGSGSDVKD